MHVPVTRHERLCFSTFFSKLLLLSTGAYTYTVYGSRRLIKAAVWLAVACICCLIIASRKHYTGQRLQMSCCMHA